MLGRGFHYLGLRVGHCCDYNAYREHGHAEDCVESVCDTVLTYKLQELTLQPSIPLSPRITHHHGHHAPSAT